MQTPALGSEVHWLSFQQLALITTKNLLRHAAFWPSSSLTLRNVAGKADSSRKPWHEAWRALRA